MKKISLEIKTASGSSYSFKGCYDDDGSVMAESWQRISKDGKKTSIDHAAYVSVNKYNELSAQYKKLIKSNQKNEANLVKLIRIGNAERYKEKGGRVIRINHDNHLGILVSSEAVDIQSSPKKADAKPAKEEKPDDDLKFADLT